MSAEYLCQADGSHEKAILTISNQIDGLAVYWSEKNAASSNGTLIGLVEEPYADFSGYQMYLLTDFYRTEDSDFRLAIESDDNRSTLMVYSLFNNDDYYEEQSKYICTLKTSSL